ncbi:LysR family transcriptional regulator [Acinetobacter baumannii]|uniref:LysR family transcriptional regulator n=1 Tax=Acinetobacter baumannii TaxID=470 RepID=UPI001057DDF9|nr:LysR family transcriptional regulator [Acinetobacter baumannii]MDC4272768.1 LysR family transcriptional regulator [Acinetobacter baumannii]MDC4422659.1 LysR family transcriptional regulator [Acinetobacter baumannii]MDC4566462.1 LysR family transcriptional regulator [Acinetobacter baumannii]MDC4854124.1 LysR family transcriptional regulator [Acinetobacter baumannii]MDC4959291.1 LysR family transcriptional regulator [Acinetobacter baumannii]
MDRLQAMETFVRVIEAGSFKQAADTLNVLPSTVTRNIKELESHLGTRLLNRTTRSISATDAGLRFYDSCKAILHELQEAEAQVSQKAEALHGTIKIGTTSSLARHCLIPALPVFTRRHPRIELELHLSDSTADVVRQGLDCVIRTGILRSSQLVARRIGRFHWIICGAPNYIAQHGTPDNLQALQQHIAVGYLGGHAGRLAHWNFQDGAQTTAIAMQESLRVDDTDAYVEAGIAGLGLIRVASYMVRDHLAAGRLIRVLEDIETEPEPISVIYPHSRHLSPAVRAFIDWSSEVMAQASSHW